MSAPDSVRRKIPQNVLADATSMLLLPGVMTIAGVPGSGQVSTLSSRGRTGDWVGELVGNSVGLLDVGDSVGIRVGGIEGELVGLAVGTLVGALEVGVCVGLKVGTFVGDLEVGLAVGFLEVGEFVGLLEVGFAVGLAVV